MYVSYMVVVDEAEMLVFANGAVPVTTLEVWMALNVASVVVDEELVELVTVAMEDEEEDEGEGEDEDETLVSVVTEIGIVVV
jgi:hypothetical protein